MSSTHRLNYPPLRASHMLTACCPCCLQLQRLLGYDPATRMTAEEALQHPFFEGEQAYRHVSQVPLTLSH